MPQFTNLRNTKKFLILGFNLLLILGVTTTIPNFLFNNNNNDSMMVYAQQLMGAPPSGMPMQPQQPQEPGEYATGTIASIQNDKNGKPSWLLSGIWQAALTNIDKEETKQNTISSISNESTTIDDNLRNAVFESAFEMVMLNGSDLHDIKIYNFKLLNISMAEEKNYTITGTATISKKDVPINDVPISIKAMNNNVISLWIDPAKINNHFGNTPIYGLIIQDVLIKK